MTVDATRGSSEARTASAAELDDVVERLSVHLGGIRRLGVAFSGGIDSTVLLALAARALRPADVVAVLAVSPSLAADEHEAALRIAHAIVGGTVEIRTHELTNPQYRANTTERCYFCKDELFTRIDDDVLEAHALDAIAYGENADDVRRRDRPGARAATEHAVLRPLATLGLTKHRVRELARALALANADKAASPCLASRIPHFEPVTGEKLQQIDRAESAIRLLGFDDFRVRHHGHLARVEFARRDLGRATTPQMRTAISRAVRAAGFTDIDIDPAGLQSGAFTLALLDAAHP